MLDLLNTNPINISTTILKSNKNNLQVGGKSKAFTKDFLFVSNIEEKVFKNTFFKKTQIANQKKQKPDLSSTNINGVGIIKS